MTVRMWGTDIDEKALEQAERTARLPIMAGHNRPAFTFGDVVQFNCSHHRR